MLISIISSFSLPVVWKLTAIIQSKGIPNYIRFAVYALLLLEVFNIASGSWYAMIDLINRLFSILIKKGNQKWFAFTQKEQQYIFAVSL